MYTRNNVFLNVFIFLHCRLLSSICDTLHVCCGDLEHTPNNTFYLIYLYLWSFKLLLSFRKIRSFSGTLGLNQNSAQCQKWHNYFFFFFFTYLQPCVYIYIVWTLTHVPLHLVLHSPHRNDKRHFFLSTQVLWRNRDNIFQVPSNETWMLSTSLHYGTVF